MHDPDSPDHVPSKKEQIEHIEATAPRDANGNSVDILEYDHLSYGQNGLAGIIASPYVCGAAFLASLGGFSFGYDQGVISLILTMSQFHEVFPETADGHPNQGFYKGFLIGMLELGAFLGCLVYPWFADKYSRKWGLSAAVAWFCAGAVIQTASMNYAMLVAGRTIGGIGVGTLALGAPLYITEIAPPNLRGSLLVLEQFSIVVGAIVSYWLTYGTSEIPNEWSWRLPFLLQMVPALTVGIGIHIFPFSPRWLCMADRSDDSLKSLAKLRRRSEQDHLVQTEWKGILTEVRAQNEIMRRRHGDISGAKLEVLGWIDLCRPRYARRTMVATAIPFFQQVSFQLTLCRTSRRVLTRA
jgi:MFS family permease